MGFKMNGFTPFTKRKKKGNDPEYQKNWKKGQSIMDDLRSLQADLKEAIRRGDKEMARKIRMDIASIRKEIERGYDESSQLNPRNPDKD